MWSQSLQGKYYFTTVFGIIFALLWMMVLSDHEFFWLYFLAYMVTSTINVLTAGFGLAQCLQDYCQGRKLRKGVEQFLYDERI